MLTYQDGDGECEKEESEWTPAAERPRLAEAGSGG